MRISDWSSDVCSSDLTPASSTVDSLETAVIDGKLVRVVSWYDNEWGFSNRMVDTAGAMAKLIRSEEHTSELQSLMRISYAVFCLKKKIAKKYTTQPEYIKHNLSQRQYDYIT